MLAFLRFFPPLWILQFPLHLLFTASCLLWHGEFSHPSCTCSFWWLCKWGQNQGSGQMWDCLVLEDRGETRKQEPCGSRLSGLHCTQQKWSFSWCAIVLAPYLLGRAGFTGNVTNVRLCRLIQSHGALSHRIHLGKMDFMPEIIHHSPTLAIFIHFLYN